MPPATLLLQRIHRLGAALLLAITLCAGMATNPAQAQGVSPPAVSAPALIPTRDITSIRPPAGDHADNPYGLRALWAQGDAVARLTLLVLAVMSLVQLVCAGQQAAGAAAHDRAGQGRRQGLCRRRGAAPQHRPARKDSPYRFIAETSLDAVRRHDSVATQVDLNTWMAQGIERAVGTVQGRTQDGLAVLATVGSTAPFVGLFGTVWGIYNALIEDRCAGPGVDRQGGRPGGRGADHDGAGSGRGGACGAGLQLAGAAQQGRAWTSVRGFGSDLHTRVLVSVRGRQHRRCGARRRRRLSHGHHLRETGRTTTRCSSRSTPRRWWT